MTHSIAKWLSYIFHPILVPLYLTGTVLYQMSYLFEKGVMIDIFRLVLMLSFIFPVLFYLFLKNRKLCDNIFVEKIEQRKLPVLLNMGLLILLAIRFSDMPSLIPFKLYFLGLLCSNVFVFILLYLKKKISLHLVYLTVSIVLISWFGIEYGLPVRLTVIAGILIMGLVGFARLKLKAHNPDEVYLAVLIGLIAQAPILLFLK